MLSEWLLVDQDEATVQELTAEDVSRNASGWLHHTCNRLFHKDMFANIRSSETLLRILNPKPEQFDPAAEALSGPFQVSLPACCSLLALCTFPVSLSACPLHLPCVSLCLPFASALCLSLLLPLPQPQWCMFCYQLLRFSSQMEPLYSDDRCLVACQHVSTWAPGIFASCARPEFCGSCLEACLKTGIPKPPCKLVHQQWKQ